MQDNSTLYKYIQDPVRRQERRTFSDASQAAIKTLKAQLQDQILYSTQLEK